MAVHGRKESDTVKDWMKAIVIYACAYVIGYVFMLFISTKTDFISNPYSSLKELLLSVVIMIPLMVLFDKLVLTRKRE